MADPYPVKPDRDFLHRILGEGGEDLKKCFQCATCSVVCELSNGRKPFPRKEMIWAQWGLRDRLLADPDIWLCYQCNDCSKHCPRGARPGDVMAALRREAVLECGVPRFLGRWVSQPRYLPLVLLIPVVLLGLALLVGYLSTRSPEGPTGGPIIFSYWSMLPHWVLISFFGLFSALVLLALVAGAMRLWRLMKAADARAGNTAPAKDLSPSIRSVLKNVVLHDDFAVCTTERPRTFSHLLVFYGFIALFLVAVWVVLLSLTARFNPLLQDDFVYAFNFWNPWRMLANLGGTAVVAGCGLMIWERLRKGKQIGAGTYSDWAFLGTLLAVVLTGFLSEALHYARMEPHRFAVYFVHLVCVFALLMYLPYSKFAHLVYRAVAMVYAEHSGRKGETAAAVAGPEPRGEDAQGGEAETGKE